MWLVVANVLALESFVLAAVQVGLIAVFLKSSKMIVIFFFFFFSLCFVGQHSQHMEIPRLGVESELQLPAYTIATATSEPSDICDLPTPWLMAMLDP